MSSIARQLFTVAAIVVAAASADRAVALSTCGGFVDVSPDSSYCQAAAWLKERSISVGCTDSSHFCPGDSVTRAAMALFLNRMAVAVAPVFLHKSESFNTATPAYVCQSTYAVQGFNRVATGTAVVDLTGNAGSANVELYYSLNGGTTWLPWATAYMSTTVPSASGHAAAATTAAPLDIPQGQTVTFAVWVSPDVAMAGYCEMTARLDNFNFGVLE